MDEYCIYLRKSRADSEAEVRGEGETLKRHERILLDLAKKAHIIIGKIYKEIVSGESISLRPEVQKLLSDVESGMWKGVLVMEVERLARGDTMDQGRVAQAFKYSYTKIITPMKIYDPNNEYDEEYFEFGLFMSRREYKTINRRLQSGRVRSALEGKYVGSVAPYGYERVKIKKDTGYTLMPHEDEANIVKIIFNLYANEGLSLSQITRKVNELGLKPRMKDKWSLNSIKDLLNNQVYAGFIRWNARKTVRTVKNGKVIKTRPRNEDVIMKEGLHPPLIDMETWEIVQEKRKQNMPPVPHGRNVRNPLVRNCIL